MLVRKNSKFWEITQTLNLTLMRSAPWNCALRVHLLYAQISNTFSQIIEEVVIATHISGAVFNLRLAPNDVELSWSETHGRCSDLFYQNFLYLLSSSSCVFKCVALCWCHNCDVASYCHMQCSVEKQKHSEIQQSANNYISHDRLF